MFLSAADLVGVNAVDLSKLFHSPLGPPGEGGGASKLLHLCNEELMWPCVGHYTDNKQDPLESALDMNLGLLLKSDMKAFNNIFAIEQLGSCRRCKKLSILIIDNQRKMVGVVE